MPHTSRTKSGAAKGTRTDGSTKSENRRSQRHAFERERHKRKPALPKACARTGAPQAETGAAKGMRLNANASSKKQRGQCARMDEAPEAKGIAAKGMRTGWRSTNNADACAIAYREANTRTVRLEDKTILASPTMKNLLAITLNAETTHMIYPLYK